jgi:hypothetical protein
VSESDPLDRPATPGEIEMVERLLKRALNWSLPKARPVPKTQRNPAAKHGPVTAVDQAMRKQIREGWLVPRSANGESGTSIQLQGIAVARAERATAIVPEAQLMPTPPIRISGRMPCSGRDWRCWRRCMPSWRGGFLYAG